MSKRDLTHWLIHHAAHSAPPALADRLEEEWLADLGARTSAISRLRFALGCCWATRVIALELGASNLSVASAVGGRNLSVAYFNGNSAFSSRRSVTFVLVVGLHVAVFIGLMTQIKIHKPPKPVPFEATTLPSPQVLPIPPPSVPIVETQIRVETPPLEPQPQIDDVDAVVAEAPPTVTTRPSDPATGAPPHTIIRAQGGPGPGFPAADDYYPSAAKRLEEQGATTVRVCVDPRGRLTSDPTTVESSGSARLDQGALQLAKAGSGRYRPATEDDRPVESCYPFRVRFQLRK